MPVISVGPSCGRGDGRPVYSEGLCRWCWMRGCQPCEPVPGYVIDTVPDHIPVWVEKGAA